MSKRDQAGGKNGQSMTAGDVETYVFDYGLVNATEHTYWAWKPENKRPGKSAYFGVTAAELMNEKTMQELEVKFAKIHVAAQEQAKKAATEAAVVQGINTKTVSESINRIRRYNNKRKYEERLGFASTLVAKAEEIGRKHTVDLLLPAIANHMVEVLIIEVG